VLVAGVSTGELRNLPLVRARVRARAWPDILSSRRRRWGTCNPSDLGPRKMWAAQLSPVSNDRASEEPGAGRLGSIYWIGHAERAWRTATRSWRMTWNSEAGLCQGWLGLRITPKKSGREPWCCTQCTQNFGMRLWL